MSARRPPVESERNLRLVSDEGRTVADPPRSAPQRPKPSPPAAGQPPRHPSMPSRSHAAHDDAQERHVSPDEGTGEVGDDGDTGGVRGDGNAGGGAPVGTAGADRCIGPADADERRVALVEPTRAHDDNELYAAIEAVLMVAVEPVEPDVLAAVTALGPTTVEAMCDDLAREYAASGRGFMLVRVAGGYQLQSAPAAAEFVERFVGGRRSARLSAAAMETLAVVAYKQPISRAQISAIRGVNADGVVRTLADQGYIAEVARDPGPGNAALLGTTPTFLERLSLDSLDDLPSLADLSVDADAAETLDRLAAGQDQGSP